MSFKSDFELCSHVVLGEDLLPRRINEGASLNGRRPEPASGVIEVEFGDVVELGKEPLGYRFGD